MRSVWFRRLELSAAAAAFAAVFILAPRIDARADTIPSSISDKEFWALTESMSEANGFFQSDNMTSNETTLSTVAEALAQRVKPGGVYLGVGPEQNLTYIAAIRPKIAFITDIRRGNLHIQLLYKAVFELSTDRADFLSLLFARERPAGLTANSSAANLINAYWAVATSDEPTYRANLTKITDQLTKTHGFQLTAEDLAGIEDIYHAFYRHGFLLNYSAFAQSPLKAGGTNYATLMLTTDSVTGQERSYLSTEDNFRFLKTLESKNLVIPLVGDFAGPKTLRAIGTYLKEHQAIVTAFYLSNVEDYLSRGYEWPVFCANVATMPLDETSTFIRPGGRGVIVSVERRRPAPFGSMAAEVAGCIGK